MCADALAVEGLRYGRVAASVEMSSENAIIANAEDAAVLGLNAVSDGRTVVLKQGATVEELVRALSAIGSTPRDIIAILQSLRSAGALEAEVEVI